MTEILLDALFLLAFAIFCLGVGYVLGRSQNRYSRSWAGKVDPPRTLTPRELRAALAPEISALHSHEKVS